mgnify:CR=1 FL=1
MSLTTEEKDKCVKLYKWLYGLDTDINSWNDEAATILAEAYGKIRECSQKMNCVPRPTLKPSLFWLFSQVFGAIARNMIHKAMISTTCKNFISNTYKTKIELALLGL